MVKVLGGENMPRVGFIEKTIYKQEGIDVKFFKDGKDVRGDLFLANNYKAGNRTKNNMNVKFLKEKLKAQYPGYDFEIYNGDGAKVHGNVTLGKVRDTYDEEE
ncbi:hypothetical protein [Candidatus Galacturonibacter soehngenii]|uniref:Uncharacterized protein n=1 Tax=Candidatus Galacturonatibacter soehngenii TaxID=2307010 RepID=A0A7V7QJ24_9FIRM|nr:hypothetical protein [Candidatus Galacturonibacter soehngenii]KAB1437573.1 hypothetical protein F7O84_08175 [Candidatus Galacturonibacter soehngenii]